MIVPRGDAELLLRPDEDVVPEPRLEVRLELRQVEEAAAAVVVAEEVEAEVEQAGRDRRPVDLEVPLLEVPAARAHEQRRDLVVQRVLLLAGIERDRPLEGVGEIHLAFDAVLPGRRVRVLEVGHEHLGAGVERVDHHLPVDRAGDLDAAVLDLRRHGRDPPVALADALRLGRKSGSSPWRSRSARSCRASSSSRRRGPNWRCEAGEEIDRVLGEDVLCTVRHVETLDPAGSGRGFCD